jgi:tRNA threonylcarbamoyladenosine modification (KEOPS) complex Cgi121 subunit
MRILRVMCGMKPDALRAALDDLDAVAIMPDVAESVDEYELAHHLAKSSFEKKTNIARSMRFEFLLWLCGKTDIKSAMKETAPREEDGGFILAVFSDAQNESVCRKLEARELPLGLKEKGEPLALERISLSRAGK